MVNLISHISKYLIILLMALYAYLDIRFLSVKSEEKKKSLLMRLNLSMFLIHLLAYMVLWLKTEDESILAFYVLQAGFFLGYLFLYPFLYPRASGLLVSNSCMLLAVGFIMLKRLELSKTSGQMMAERQFLIAVIGAVITLLVPFAIERLWQLASYPWVYAVVGIILLGAVLIGGQSSYGARISLTLGNFSFQPAEFVKITFVFFAASLFYRSVSRKTIGAATAAAAVHIFILGGSRDLGSALIFALTYLLMLFVATGKWLYLAAGTLFAGGASVAAFRLFSHVRTRVIAWLDPWSDIDNRGYQITQSLFAIGTGGWFGMGLYEGMPERIPVVEKDFIFSAVSEELGGITAVCLLLVCFGIFLQFILLAGRMKAMFYKLLAFGFGVVYIIQVFLNVGGVTKFIPSTGVTLPFVSYGGSSVISTFIVMGIIQGLYIIKSREEEVKG